MTNILFMEIHKDEIKPTILGSLLLGVRTIGKTMGWAALYSYLINSYKLGGLPLIWVLFSILGMIGSLLYLFFADAIKKETLLKYYCLITGSFMILAGLAGFFDTGKTLFLIFAFGAYALGTSSLGSQTWTVINAAFTPKQGLRIYPLITLAPLVGGILGGIGSQYLSVYLSDISDKLNITANITRICVFIWGICILSVIPLLTIFQKNYLKEPKEQPRNTTLSFSRFWSNFKDGCNYTFHNKLMLSIAGICFLFWLVASFKEYPYSQIIREQFKDIDKLNQYMGILNTSTKSCIVIMQLCITSWIIQRLGVGKSLLLLPFTILIGLISLSLGLCLGLNNDQLFWIAFGMIFFWEEIAQTIQGTAYQMTFHAVEYSYRGRVRGIVEGIFNNAGGIIGGVLLYFCGSAVALTTSNILKNQAQEISRLVSMLIVSMIGIFLALIWVFVAYQAKKNYQNSIITNLQSKDKKTKKDAEDLKDLISYSLEEKKAQYAYARDDETIVQKNVLGGYFVLYFRQDYGCKKMRLELPTGTWVVSGKNNCLMLQKLVGNIPRLASSTAEMIYWQTNSGYLAVYWEDGLIKTIEIGNYTTNRIELMHCKQDTFQGPFEMLNQGKLVLPQQRFFTAIVTSGEEVKY